MYRAWQHVHEEWPRSTLELFENWHDHVDNLLSTNVRRVVAAITPIDMLDLGSGNGLQTLWLRAQIKAQGGLVRRLNAYDWQPHAIEWAQYWARNLEDVVRGGRY